MSTAQPPVQECPETKREVEVSAPVAKSPTIDINLLNQWANVKDVKNYYKTDQFHVAGNYFRVNIWSRTSREDCIMDLFAIPFSYYVEYKDGVLTDKTIHSTNKIKFRF